MHDRSAERSCHGALRVNVNPLIVAGYFGKFVDVLLGDLHPVAYAELLANAAANVVESVDDKHASTFLEKQFWI